MRARLLGHAVIVAALLLIVAASRVDAGDETCYPIEVTWYSPSGVAGCTLDGPTSGIASVYAGDAAAANWCVHPWTDCGSVIVQSHRTGLTITVPVGMYCDCWWTTDRRLVDLTPGQVGALGLDPADGLFEVTVTPIDPASAGGGLREPVAGSLPVIPPAPSLPDTALLPQGGGPSVIDYYRTLYEQYEREIGPAREVIRRAQARLRDAIARAPELEADPRFTTDADPTEPNGAEFAVEALLEHPQLSLLAGGTPVAPDASAPDPRSAAVSSPPRDDSPATPDQPRPVRSGQGQRRHDGRRAPADAAAPSTSSSGPVGTPASASQPPARGERRPESERSSGPASARTHAPAASFACDHPGCDRAFGSPSALGIHRGRMHGKRPSRPTPADRVATRASTRAAAAAADPDRRVIDELCPKGCGRRFRWEPSLLTHSAKCDGKPA